MALPYRDLRGFIELSRALGEVREISGADWDLEVGALIEAVAEREDPAPLLLFDDLVGHLPGFRAAGLTLGSAKRCAVAMGLPVEASKLQLVQDGHRAIQAAVAHATKPLEVPDGPLMDRSMFGDDVDLLAFPAPRYRAGDGGRYIGTGVAVINRDPDSGYVNVGTYRVQLHDERTLGLWMSPGQHGREICAAYWSRGTAAPIAIAFGMDPALFMMAHAKIPWGVGEFDVLGGLYGDPLEVVSGPMTGLPLPAYAEIVVEGQVPPPTEESRAEGPFGEWTGYFAAGTVGRAGEPQPVVNVTAIHHRTAPIILAQPPTWYGAPTRVLPFESGALWGQLEAAGIPGITGVFQHTMYLIAVSIEQKYAGHAKQVGHGVISCAAGARNGRWVVVVDDDIDVTSIDEVLWAMQTRCDPQTDIDVVAGTWSTPLDPRLTPQQRERSDHTNSRGIMYAVRPFGWRDEYPAVSRIDRHTKDEVYRRLVTEASDAS